MNKDERGATPYLPVRQLAMAEVDSVVGVALQDVEHVILRLGRRLLSHQQASVLLRRRHLPAEVMDA